ncbi:hypothetical protein BIV57_01120 [Mangrovactinospora gilvigrisea]|uniref:GAF domain-containing protein n=1 Tax=Mangrovactinospora gilvigrisea TaxID=1428644 RepID=A0A1J7C156_9ACTN|nr:hypothetical protein BIV57_01120 [Mangrovactinospora gilvigrisea]
MAGEGPTIEAAISHRPVLVADLVHTPQRRWPRLLADPATGQGPRALIALPVEAAGAPVGVLAAYRKVPDLPSRAAIRALKAVAEEVGVLLARGPLEVPVLHRAVVHQAAGALAHAEGVSLQDAADRILARVFASGEDLIDGAEKVLEQLR